MNENYDCIKLLKTIFKTIPTHVYFKDPELRYVFASDTCQKYIEELTGQNLIGKKDSDLYNDQSLIDAFNKDDISILKSKKGIHYISEIILDNGITYCDVNKEPVLDEHGEILGIISVIHDITEQKNLEIKQRNLNRIDALTGLYNRLCYEERLENILSEENLPLSIIIGDTNQLKAINDNYGHSMGDSLLKATASILKKSVASSGEIYRIGGDEFLVFCHQTNEAKCKDIISRIRCLEIKLYDFQFPIKTSLGYAIVNSIDDDISEKIRIAEKNMYLDKRWQKEL